MPPSARSRSAIRTSRGTLKAPMAGQPSACHWMMRRRSHARATEPIPRRESLFARRASVQRVLDRPSQIKQPLLDQDRHVADIGYRFPPLLKDAGLPCKLVCKLVALRLIDCRLFLGFVLHFPQLLGFL